MAIPIDEEDVQAVRVLLDDLLSRGFPQPDDDPDCELEARKISRHAEGADYHYDVAEFRRGKFVLDITDDCFGHRPSKIVEGLKSFREWDDLLREHGKLALSGPNSVPPDMDVIGRIDHAEIGASCRCHTLPSKKWSALSACSAIQICSPTAQIPVGCCHGTGAPARAQFSLVLRGCRSKSGGCPEVDLATCTRPW